MFVSFRDPFGNLAQIDENIFRFVNSDGCDDLESFLNSRLAKELVDAGHIVSSETVSDKQRRHLPETFHGKGGRVLRHDRISFPSYPYEWSPAMLYAAAELTLMLAGKLEMDQLELKDATPFNILFSGSKPIFVDILSFIRLDPNNQL